MRRPDGVRACVSIRSSVRHASRGREGGPGENWGGRIEHYDAGECTVHDKRPRLRVALECRTREVPKETDDILTAGRGVKEGLDSHHSGSSSSSSSSSSSFLPFLFSLKKLLARFGKGRRETSVRFRVSGEVAHLDPEGFVFVFVLWRVAYGIRL
ncbi:uncharacterized protein LY79DRAFT_197361 [Colletotrichum navitas]|uniref:Uncharacterized protein n=1 Tax=Colletotrichum navitas TaxID=681940 RepID=A0AAD8V4R3_9PEZI|nr:uncharacterized protein LY79DRAFT_197361 [Colletotrichum navitas]KAK1590687.1 hypothetical protein LY79DRAFT_197361 [Colletotrichum navitas]